MSWLLLSLCVLVQPGAPVKEKVQALIERLKDDRDEAHWEAATELGLIGPAAKEALPALRKRLEAKDSRDRACVAAALLLIDQAEAEKAFAVIQPILKDPAELLAHLHLMRLLGQELKPTSQGTIQGLLRLAGDESSLGWVIADLALKRIEKPGKEVIAGLEQGLKDTSLKARVQAARALGRLDPSRLKEILPALREGLALKDLSLRLWTAEALVSLSPDEKKRVIESLTPDLRSKAPGVRVSVAAYFLELDPALAEQALPVLGEVIGSENVADAQQALRRLRESLEKQPSLVKTTQPLFEKALASAEVGVIQEALRQLGQLGPVGRPLERLLRDPLDDRRPAVSATALEAQIRLRPERGPDRIPRLIELIEKRDRTANGITEFIQRFESIRKQQEMKKDEPWVVGLADLIDRSEREGRDGWNRDELLRLHAIAEVYSLGPKALAAAPSLAKLLTERDGVKPVVRSQAALALGRIGKQARDAIPILNRVIRDDRDAPDVRAAAREALKLIDRDKDQ